jgi:hypothetical protein
MNRKELIEKTIFLYMKVLVMNPSCWYREWNNFLQIPSSARPLLSKSLTYAKPPFSQEENDFLVSFLLFKVPNTFVKIYPAEFVPENDLDFFVAASRSDTWGSLRCIHHRSESHFHDIALLLPCSHFVCSPNDTLSQLISCEVCERKIRKAISLTTLDMSWIDISCILSLVADKVNLNHITSIHRHPETNLSSERWGQKSLLRMIDRYLQADLSDEIVLSYLQEISKKTDPKDAMVPYWLVLLLHCSASSTTTAISKYAPVLTNHLESYNQELLHCTLPQLRCRLSNFSSSSRNQKMMDHL